MSQNSWNQTLEKIIQEEKFLEQIKNKGYFISDISFKNFTERYGFSSSQNTASYLSIDFWSGQSSVLKENNLYLLRIGRGNFVILNQKVFPKSYPDLKITNPIQLKPETSEFEDLIDAFNVRQENAGLEQLNVLGVYDALVSNLFGNEKWHIGPRGNKVSKFSIYGKKEDGKVEMICNYDGQEELDYTIWTKDHILLFEAKSLPQNFGLDIGWHKLAYPASRFRKYSKYKILPIYFLKWESVVHLFVFPCFKFYEHGIIINDQERQIPDKIFRIDLKKTIDNF